MLLFLHDFEFHFWNESTDKWYTWNKLKKIIKCTWKFVATCIAICRIQTFIENRDITSSTLQIGKQCVHITFTTLYTHYFHFKYIHFKNLLIFFNQQYFCALQFIREKHILSWSSPLSLLFLLSFEICLISFIYLKVLPVSPRALGCLICTASANILRAWIV